MLIGYTDTLSLGPTEAIAAHVSTEAASVAASVVRLGPGSRPGGPMPDFSEIEVADLGTSNGLRQEARPGSYLVAPPPANPAPAATLLLRIWPSLGSPGGQGLAVAGGICLVLDDRGAPALLDRDGRTCVAGSPLRLREWHLLIASRGPDGSVRLHQRTISGMVRDALTAEGRGEEFAFEEIVLAALPGRAGMRAHFHGKLADPLLSGVESSAAEMAAVGDLEVPEPRSLVACWDFAANPASDVVVDRGPGRLDGRLVNAPMRAVTGPRHDDAVDDWRRDPDGYSAIHFHGDDLDDAAWSPTFSWRVPPATPSGVYAFRLVADGEIDRVPFVVRPAAAVAPVAVLLPTLTYLAYANERLGREMVDPGPGWYPDLDPRDELLASHPEWGRSLYDTHDDGSGVCHSSLLRPIPNLRPDYRSWFVDGGRHLAGDLLLLNWLDRQGVDFDLITDHDLDRLGVDVLDPYTVVITGGHPEYVSRAILEAVEAFVYAGGRLMYLGGNGFYWVTDVAGAGRQRIEVRRGLKGARAWESAPGEQHQATSGEPGGLWRDRGRPPNRLTGVGFSAQGWDGQNRPYLATEAAVHFPWVFEGVDLARPIAASGHLMGAAAGDEIDRADEDRGTPPEAVVLASARGFSDAYQLVVEDVPEMHPDTGGTSSPLVRADMTLMAHPGGGAIFSVGSIEWSTGLEDDSGLTDAGRITANVLRRFLSSVALSKDAARATLASESD